MYLKFNLDSKINHPSENNITRLKQFSHCKECVSSFSCTKLFTLKFKILELISIKNWNYVFFYIPGLSYRVFWKGCECIFLDLQEYR